VSPLGGVGSVLSRGPRAGQRRLGLSNAEQGKGGGEVASGVFAAALTDGGRDGVR
jgi:hypothetical protein